jgi:hypothetical protein
MSKEETTSASPGRPDSLSLRRAMRLESHDRDSGTTAELYRLRQRGLIHWRPKRMEWAIVAQHTAGMCELVTGDAFTLPCQAGDRTRLQGRR